MFTTVITVLDLIGVFVFALSGALAASKKKMDIFGYVVIALLPAVGGGTLRDLILDTPVFWINQPVYLFVAAIAGVITFVAPSAIERRTSFIAWADAVGLSLFCVLGASKALALSGNLTIAVTMGVTTAVAGGIIRDVVTNEVPLVLHKEIYATAAFIGALVFCLLVVSTGNETIALLIGGTSAFAIRAAALYFGLSLPAR